MSAPDSPIQRFTRAAQDVSQEVIRTYSTSFGAATALLGRRHRRHIRNIYALVRVADEIVDGVAGEAGLDRGAQRQMLERYIEQTHDAMRTGYSTDLVIHAFAHTATAAGITEELTGPFFDSMRTDLDSRALDGDAHREYVYGSAEVVGLMCLRVFLRDITVSPAERRTLEHGARQLGAAFQNVNFLRDLADDTGRLGRSYLPGQTTPPGRRLSAQDKDAWVRLIEGQIDDAALVIPLLPADARAAVRSALLLFRALLTRVASTPVEELYRRRVRVPDLVKAALTLRALGTTWTERAR